MQQALVDTSVLIAGTFEKDDNHEKGLELLRAFDRGKLPRGVVPTPMLKELLDFTLERKSPGDAEDVLDRLQESGGFEIVYPARSDFERGKLLFRRHAELGLADAMLVGLAERT
ncbi:MAG: type II toxin-antitoxin system VapC family toxin, partial [Halobaculum sp.]